MQVNKVDIITVIVFGVLYLILICYGLYGCSADSAVSSQELHQKCLNAADSTECGNGFTIYY